MKKQTPQNLLNLQQLGYLQEAPGQASSADAFFNRAAGSLASTQQSSLRSHDRFIVAYEGLFALALGILSLYDLRPGDKEGHRVTALQGAMGVIGLDPIDLAMVARVHEQRNTRIYKMPIDASEADASDAVRLLQLTLGLALSVKAKVQNAGGVA